jgi:hypothetical protein
MASRVGERKSWIPFAILRAWRTLLYSMKDSVSVECRMELVAMLARMLMTRNVDQIVRGLRRIHIEDPEELFRLPPFQRDADAGEQIPLNDARRVPEGRLFHHVRDVDPLAGLHDLLQDALRIGELVSTEIHLPLPPVHLHLGLVVLAEEEDEALLPFPDTNGEIRHQREHPVEIEAVGDEQLADLLEESQQGVHLHRFLALDPVRHALYAGEDPGDLVFLVRHGGSLASKDSAMR